LTILIITRQLNKSIFEPGRRQNLHQKITYTDLFDLTRPASYNRR